jgi:hypothetical protein
MELLEPIESQMISNRLPLVAVTVAAVPYANTPVVLSLHWHGFVEHKLLDVQEAHALRYESVPSSVLQVNERWDNFGQLERAALDVAWELGAWDMARTEAPPCRRFGAATAETLDCLRAFGCYPYTIDGQPPFVAETPDVGDLLEVAVKRGYVKWQFRPVRGGLWEEVSDDVTLEPGGYRNPPCPLLPEPPRLRKARQVVYRFGKSENE